MCRVLFITLVGVALFPLQRLASAAQDPVALPDPKLFQQLFATQANTGGVAAVAFSPDGKKLISGGTERFDNGRTDGPPNVKIWDVNTGQQLLAVRTGYKDGPIGFSPDGKRFVCQAIRLLDEAKLPTQIRDATTGQPLVPLEPWVSCVVFSPDGKHILGCTSKHPLVDARLGLWDAATGRIVRNLSKDLAESNERVALVAFSPDGKQFVTRGGRPVMGQLMNQTSILPLIHVWDTDSGKVTLTKPLSVVSFGLAFGPKGKVIVGGHDLNSPPTAWVKVFDATSGRETLSLKVHGTGAYSVCCSADGKRIVSGYYDGTVRVWDGETGKGLAILRGHVNVVHSVAISPDGTKIASGGSDGTVRIWGIPGNQQPQQK